MNISRHQMRIIRLQKLINLFVVLGGLVFVGTCYGRQGLGEQPMREVAERLIAQSDLEAGMILHIGSGDGRLTGALHGSGQFVVHGLDLDAANVEEGRQFLCDSGINGFASIHQWDGYHLPYAENLINLIIAEDTGDIEIDELLRVLTPRGVLLLKQDDGVWEKTVKAVPEEIDDWTHYLYGPTNNAVSNDSRVGTPKHIQWITGPKFARSHEITTSLSGMVSAGGRLFYIWDEAPIAVVDKRLPQKWALIARDAFNGVELWKQPMPRWGWPQWHDDSRWDDPLVRGRMLVNSPSTLPRRMVASAEHLYITLGYDAPVSLLDAATGEILKVFEETALTDEILLDGERLILRVRTIESPPEADFWETMTRKPRGCVMVLDTESGQRIWQSPADDMAPLTLAVSGGRVYYSNYREIVCLELDNGAECWRSVPVDSPNGRKSFGGTLLADGGVVLYTSMEGDTFSFDGETGELLWKGPDSKGVAVDNPPDLFLADGLVWLGETDPSRLGNDPKLQKTALDRQGLDPVSGKAVRDISVPSLLSPGHHFRCYRSKATNDFLLLPKRGVEFVDLDGDNHMRNDWLRGPCSYGVLPANGLLYTAPHQCVCYPGVLLSNFNVMGPGLDSKLDELHPAPGNRLVKGPAYGRETGNLRNDPDDWPTYRHDALRSGSAEVQVPEKLDAIWDVKFGSRVTAPVVAGGRLYVAEIDTHQVHALDARTGRKLWQFAAGGRVDSPPTVLGSLVIFGSRDWRIGLALSGSPT
jgi:outer membrane protein assembly factor BamB